jgi:hypothetical protein
MDAILLPITACEAQRLVSGIVCLLSLLAALDAETLARIVVGIHGLWKENLGLNENSHTWDGHMPVVDPLGNRGG